MDAIVKNLNFGEKARVNVFKGIEKLTTAVSSTLGASGKCVMLEDSSGRPVITKDGVTVADSIILIDPVENMGATLLKEAARKTVREAGDGTTTATVLAHSILQEAYKVSNKTNSRELKDGINSAVKKVIKYLESTSIDAKGQMINQIATISTNNDKELGSIIVDGATSTLDATNATTLTLNVDDSKVALPVADELYTYLVRKNGGNIISPAANKSRVTGGNNFVELSLNGTELTRKNIAASAVTNILGTTDKELLEDALQIVTQ